MIALVILIGIARARVLSVTDHREKEAQGHGCGGDQEDDQAKLATGIAPGLARQPAENHPHTDEPGVSHAPRLCPPHHLRQWLETHRLPFATLTTRRRDYLPRIALALAKLVGFRLTP